MKRTLALGLCLALLLVGSICLAGKKPGNMEISIDVDWALTEPVSLFCAPDGSGNYLTAAFTYGGNPVDASILVTLRLGDMAMFGVPAEDILLVPGGNQYELCGEEGAVCGFGATDGDGTILLTGSIPGSGYSDPSGEGSCIVVSTTWINTAYEGNSGRFPLYMNSADIDKDGVVNLEDLSILAQDQDKLNRLGKYNYRSDLNWDGQIDETDAQMLYSAYGASCQ